MKRKILAWLSAGKPFGPVELLDPIDPAFVDDHKTLTIAAYFAVVMEPAFGVQAGGLVVVTRMLGVWYVYASNNDDVLWRRRQRAAR